MQRQEFILETTAGFCARLGIEVPPIVFKDYKLGVPVALMRLDMASDGSKLAEYEQPRLMIYPESEEMSDEELRYLLALSLARLTTFKNGFLNPLLLLLPLFVPIALFLYLSIAVTWWWILGVPATLAAFPFWALLVIDIDAPTSHLRAVKLTGDRITGVKLLRKRKWAGIFWSPAKRLERRLKALPQ